VSVPISNLSRWDEKLLKEVVVDRADQFKLGSDSASMFGSRTVEIQGTLTPRVSHVTVVRQPGDRQRQLLEQQSAGG
jgi:hypothetical protein